MFAVIPTEIATLVAAATFAQRYRLQFRDSVIWQASSRGGADILFTEDLQHGFTVGGLRAVNPFVEDRDPDLVRLLGR